MARKKKHSASEEFDLEKTFQETAKAMNGGKDAPAAPKKGRKGLWIALIACFSGLVLLCGAAVLLLGGFIGNFSFPEGVTIAGVDVSGMNHSSAVAAVSEAVENSYNAKHLRVTVGEQTVALTPKQTEAGMNTQLVVAAALIMQRQAGEFDITPFLHLNEESIRQGLAVLKAPYENSSFTESSYTISGTRPELTEEHIEDPTQQLEVYIGTPDYDFNEDDLYAAAVQALKDNSMTAVYEVPTKHPSAINLEAIHESEYVEPIDAVMDPKTFEVTQHSYGYGLDLEACKKSLAEANYGETVTLSFVRIPPKETHASLSSILFRDLLGTYTARSGSSYNRDTNLRLACASLNGKVLMPGEVFSYNAALGERTAAKGYKPADSYMGSQTVQTYGGGICQPSSSLYYCTLIADLEIVERHYHGFVSSYMPYGMDATVDWSGPDFKFRNSSEYPIKIEATSQGGTVYMSIYGTDTKNYYVKMEYSILSVDHYTTRYEEMAPNNAKGYKNGQTITSPYTGYTVDTYKCKYDKETNELISRTFEARSKYARRDKVVCKIVTPAAPAPETPPATTPTEPTTTPTEPTTTPTEPPTAETSGSGGNE